MSIVTGIYSLVAVAIVGSLGSFWVVVGLVKLAERPREPSQRVVPPGILQTLGVKPGDALVWEVVTPGTVRVRRAERPATPPVSGA